MVKLNKKGVTLVEMIITVAILSILFGVGPEIFIRVTRFYAINRARIEVQRDARAILNLINRNLRQATSSSIVIDKAAGQPPCSRITFAKAQGTTMTFYQQNNKLMMQVGTLNKQLIDNVRYIAFTFPMSDDMTVVSISLTLERDTFEAKTKSIHLAVEKVRIMN